MWQKKTDKISSNELYFWLVFWIIAAAVIIFIKKVDILVANLGFSGSGIQVLLYLGIVVMFYMIFKLRLRLEKQDRELTKIVRFLALKDKEK